MKNTKLRKTLSLLLCMLMLVGMFPVSTFAAAEDGICEHHLEHTADCGYNKGSEGSPCTHICNDSCTLSATSCVHTHDENCGYVAAVEGTPCSHAWSGSSGCMGNDLPFCLLQDPAPGY